MCPPESGTGDGVEGSGRRIASEETDFVERREGEDELKVDSRIHSELSRLFGRDWVGGG